MGTEPIGPGHPVYDQVRALVDQMPDEIAGFLVALIDEAVERGRQQGWREAAAAIVAASDRAPDDVSVAYYTALDIVEGSAEYLTSVAPTAVAPTEGSQTSATA